MQNEALRIGCSEAYFETPLGQIINIEHTLVLLARRFNWASLEEIFSKLYVP